MNSLTRRLTALPTARLTLASHPTRALFSTTRSTSSTPDGMPDSLAQKSFKGKTGGGEPLKSTSSGAPAQPKISNLSVPGRDGEEGRESLTKEQKEEVERHNKEFERLHEQKDSHEKLQGGEGKEKGLPEGKQKGGKKGGEDGMNGPPKDSKGGYEY